MGASSKKNNRRRPCLYHTFSALAGGILSQAGFSLNLSKFSQFSFPFLAPLH